MQYEWNFYNSQFEQFENNSFTERLIQEIFSSKKFQVFDYYIIQI